MHFNSVSCISFSIFISSHYCKKHKKNKKTIKPKTKQTGDFQKENILSGVGYFTFLGHNCKRKLAGMGKRDGISCNLQGVRRQKKAAHLRASIMCITGSVKLRTVTFKIIKSYYYFTDLRILFSCIYMKNSMSL